MSPGRRFILSSICAFCAAVCAPNLALAAPIGAPLPGGCASSGVTDKTATTGKTETTEESTISEEDRKLIFPAKVGHGKCSTQQNTVSEADSELQEFRETMRAGLTNPLAQFKFPASMYDSGPQPSTFQRLQPQSVAPINAFGAYETAPRHTIGAGRSSSFAPSGAVNFSGSGPGNFTGSYRPYVSPR